MAVFGAASKGAGPFCIKHPEGVSGFYGVLLETWLWGSRCQHHGTDSTGADLDDGKATIEPLKQHDAKMPTDVKLPAEQACSKPWDTKMIETVDTIPRPKARGIPRLLGIFQRSNSLQRGPKLESKRHQWHLKRLQGLLNRVLLSIPSPKDLLFRNWSP